MNTTTRSRKPLAIITAWCVVAALMMLHPPTVHADSPRLPADAAVVDGVPVLQWPAVANAASYELQVSASPTFADPILNEKRGTPAYVFAGDVEPGTYYWRYRAFAGDDTRIMTSPTWTFTRDAEDGPVLLEPVDDDDLLYPEETPTLRWEPIPAFGSYLVQWDRNPDFRSPEEATTTATAFTLPELMPHDDTATIHWRVRAIATELEDVKSSWSQQRSFVVSWGPDAPVQLTPTNESSVDDAVDQVVYEWEATPGAATYELQVALDNRFTTLIKPDTGQNYPSSSQELPFIVYGTKYIAPSRYPAKSHWWRVRALDAKGSPGPWSDAEEPDEPDEPSQFTRRWTQGNEAIGSTVTTTDTDPATWAARPNDVTLDSSVPLNEFEMTWDEVPDATYYEVEIRDDLQSAVCRTPNNHFAPPFLGSYKDAGREWDCPIRVPESALPPVTESAYEGDGSTLTVFGSGAAVDSYVVLYFGLGDGDNGKYLVTGVVPDDPGTELIDESAFTVTSSRLGSGMVKWRAEPTLVLTPGVTYSLRVRAVHESSGGLVYSVWSDQASYPNETPPGTAVVTPSEDSAGSGSLTQPANPTAPDTGRAWTEWPVLRWEAAVGAEAYLVAIAKDREFTNSVIKDHYYVTRGTSLVPQTTLAENNAGGSYYWYVLPCAVYVSPQDNDCFTADHEAILQSGRWRSFQKSSNPLAELMFTPSADQPWVGLAWDDMYESNPLGTGGFKQYEVQITESTWDVATTLITETAALTTSDLDLAPSSEYRWRVRAIDGGLLPLPWSQGPEFTMPAYPGPDGLSTGNDATRQPCLTWDASAHASGYTVEVYRGTNPAYPISAKIAEQQTAYPSWCPTDLPSGSYSWQVTSKHAKAGPSLWSPAAGAATFTVSAAKPELEQPTEPITTDELVFDWTPVPGAAKYLIELSADSFWTVATAEASVTDMWTPVAVPVGEYAWRVSALDNSGNVLSTSDTGELSVVEPLTITSVTPSSGPTAGGTSVTITGTGFDPAADVTFDTQAVTVVNRADNAITVTTPPHAAGAVDVTVTNPTGRSMTATSAFTYIAPPTITSVSPSTGPTAGGTRVTILGSDFHNDAEVTFDGSPASVLDRDASTGITVSTPSHPAGSVDVLVTNPDGQEAVATSAFTYVAPPTITSLEPSSGSTNGGTLVLIRGGDFHPDATVTIDGAPAAVTDREGTTGILITTPAHGPGQVTVVVTNPDGQSASGAFSYIAPPTISAVSPNSGPTDGYTRVTVTGTGFNTNATVMVGDMVAEVVDRQGSTAISLVTAVHAAGPVDVIVTNPDGQQAIAKGAFTFVGADGSLADLISPPQFVAPPRLKVVGATLRVRWSRPTSPGSPPDEYRVMLKKTSKGAFRQVAMTSLRKTRIKVRSGRTYWVRIMAHSEAGWGEPGPVARVRTR
jgi:hypothetical protein